MVGWGSLVHQWFMHWKPHCQMNREILPVMECRDMVWVSGRVSRPVFWSLGLSLDSLRSGLEGLLLGLELFVSRLCIGYFLWSFATNFLKKRFQKLIVQNLAVQRGRWLSFLCCLRVGENNLPSTPFKIDTEFSKNVHVPMKPQRVISATRGWEYTAKDYLWTVCPRVLLWIP